MARQTQPAGVDGEFGVYYDYTDADSRARWLRDARTLAEQWLVVDERARQALSQ